MSYFITRKILKQLIKPYVGVCRGLENIPQKGGVIFAANHASYLDHFVVGLNLLENFNKHPRFLAKKEHFESFWQKRWHNYLKAIPVDRESGGKEALKEALQELRDDAWIMIYPEGTRTLTGELQRGKTGVARLALEARVPVVPIGITNTFEIWPKGKKIPQKGNKANINVGKPKDLSRYYGGENNRDLIREATNEIMQEIARLAGQIYKHY